MMSLPPSFETTFASYTRGRQLGEGGAGTVFEVVSHTGESFALKLLKRESLHSDKHSRFKNEIAFCSRDQHPNLLRVQDSGFVLFGDAKCPFYVMPLYPTTLRKGMGGIAIEARLPLFAKILDGVEAAHLKGVWHRDLKPENILLDKSNTPVVADFGIAHFTEEELVTLVETSPQARLANFQYAAPEQRRVGASVDHRADIYALGLILNELFTGQIVAGSDPARVATHEQSLGYLDDIVNLMLRQDPSARPPTIDAVKRLLTSERNTFFSRQTLSRLDSTVIPTGVVDDPLVRQPVVITSVDYRERRLHFTLTPAPNFEWTQTFSQVNYRSCLMGKSPPYYRFSGDTVSIDASEHEAARVVEDSKRFVATANQDYAMMRERQVAERERRDREQLLSAKRAEAERLRVLGSIRL